MIVVSDTTPLISLLYITDPLDIFFEIRSVFCMKKICIIIPCFYK